MQDSLQKEQDQQIKSMLQSEPQAILSADDRLHNVIQKANRERGMADVLSLLAGWVFVIFDGFGEQVAKNMNDLKTESKNNLKEKS
ncbi:MAG: hypothetical protein ACI9KN_000619 [Gammaproteobacteria bacterium]|jgi:hypothetical protein